MAAPSSGSLAKWTDITALFTELNTVRSKWGYGNVSPTTGTSAGGQNNMIRVTPTLTEIETYIEQMNGNAYVARGYNASTGQTTANAATVNYTIPAIGDLIKPAPLVAYFDTLSRVNGICSFDGGFFASNNGFSPFGSNNGFSPFSGNNGFSPFGSNNGFSPFGGNNGFSPFSGNNGFSPFGSNNGFSPFGGNNGFSPFSGNNGFSPFSGNNGFSPFSGNNGFSPFSSNNGFNAFGGWFSSFNPKSSFYS